MFVYMGVALTLSLSPKNFDKIVRLSKLLGVSKSAVVNFMLDSPTNAYILLLAYTVFHNLSKEEVISAIEFGEYALWSDPVLWFNSHDWSSKEPNRPNFHEHINLINVCFDWRGWREYKELYDACKSFLNPSVKDIANKTGWSSSKVKRLLSFFIGKKLVLKCGSGKKVFFDCAFAPIPSPLIRFNPKRFSAEKKDQYNRIWKEVIKEVFGVEVKVALVHLPDKVIALKPSNLPNLFHRLSYCNRHPITEILNFSILGRFWRIHGRTADLSTKLFNQFK